MATKSTKSTAARKARDKRAKAETADANRYFEALAKRQAKGNKK